MDWGQILKEEFMEKMTAAQQQMVLDNYNLVHYVMHKKFPSY